MPGKREIFLESGKYKMCEVASIESDIMLFEKEPSQFAIAVPKMGTWCEIGIHEVASKLRRHNELQKENKVA